MTPAASKKRDDGLTVVDPIAAERPLRAPDHYAPRGVTYPRAWSAIIVLSVANLLVALAIGMLAGVAGYANVMRQPTIYQSGAVMLIDQPLALSAGDAGVVVKLNTLRGKYVALIGTAEIMAPAAKIAGLSIADVRRAQRPVIPTATLTLLPLARTQNPLKSQKIAQATAEALQNYVADEQAATGLNPAQRISLRIVQNAGPGGRVSPLTSKAQQTALIFGAAGMLVAYVALQLLAAARRNRTQL